MASTLPPPDVDAQSHSAHLREVIQEQVIAAGGHLPFWKFMELALGRHDCIWYDTPSTVRVLY